MGKKGIFKWIISFHLVFFICITTVHFLCRAGNAQFSHDNLVGEFYNWNANQFIPHRVTYPFYNTFSSFDNAVEKPWTSYGPWTETLITNPITGGGTIVGTWRGSVPWSANLPYSIAIPSLPGNTGYGLFPYSWGWNVVSQETLDKMHEELNPIIEQPYWEGDET